MIQCMKSVFCFSCLLSLLTLYFPKFSLIYVCFLCVFIFLFACFLFVLLHWNHVWNVYFLSLFFASSFFHYILIPRMFCWKWFYSSLLFLLRWCFSSVYGLRCCFYFPLLGGLFLQALMGFFIPPVHCLMIYIYRYFLFCLFYHMHKIKRIKNKEQFDEP